MNFRIDFENITNNTHRIKLDDILESIKLIKSDQNIINDIRIAIKVLNRYKQIESSKW